MGTEQRSNKPDPLEAAGWTLRVRDVAQGALWAARAEGLGPEVAEDVAQMILERLLRADPSDVRAPRAYLRAALRNETRAIRRRQSRESSSLPPEIADNEDQFGAILEVERVRAGLRAAYEAGEHEAVQVAVVWLDLSDELGSEPTLRNVGAVLGISHTSVRRRLGRLRRFM